MATTNNDSGIPGKNFSKLGGHRYTILLRKSNNRLEYVVTQDGPVAAEHGTNKVIYSVEILLLFISWACSHFVYATNSISFAETSIGTGFTLKTLSRFINQKV